MSRNSDLVLFDNDHTVEWSEANLCLCWVTESDGRAWHGWWEGKPKLERDLLLKLYRDELERADIYSHGHMVPFDAVWADLNRAAQEEEALIDRWALDIRNAAMNMQPFPFVTPEKLREEGGHVPLHYPHRLAAAIARAGIVIIERPAEQVPTRRRRHATMEASVTDQYPKNGAAGKTS